jgi:broad specificity phosphatase PhoE
VHNATGVMQGQLDTPLDDVGRQQARAAAAAFAGAALHRMVTSDLSRAAETAAAVSRVAGIPAAPDARLREVHLGTWQGLTGEQAQRQHPDEWAAWRAGRDVRRGGGETYAEAGRRAADCLHEALAGLPPGGALLAVTHGGTARAALGVLLELQPASWGRLAPLGNACWSTLVEAPWGWRLERHNAAAGTLGSAVAPVS